MPASTISSRISSTTAATNGVWLNGTATWNADDYVSYTVEKSNEDTGISPHLYFKYVKKNFSLLEQFRLERKIKKIEKAFNEAVENGQEALALKFLDTLARETRESVLYVKGIRFFIERDVLNRYKNKINKGHISDTPYEDYTRVIPPEVLKRKKELDGVFDSLVIYHYWSEEAKDVKKMSQSEKAKMKDPVLFGRIKESNRLYFIADWQDEFCDLTFDEIIDVVGGKSTDYELNQKVDLSIT